MTRTLLSAVGLSMVVFAGVAVASPCDRLSTDINNDGVTNIADQVAFNTYYFAGDSRADYNADGSVNIADLFLAHNHILNGIKFSYMDLDFDGDVDNDDVAIFDGLGASLRCDFTGDGVTNALDRIVITTC